MMVLFYPGLDLLLAFVTRQEKVGAPFRDSTTFFRTHSPHSREDTQKGLDTQPGYLYRGKYTDIFLHSIMSDRGHCCYRPKMWLPSDYTIRGWELILVSGPS